MSKNGHDHKVYLLLIMDDLVFVVLKKSGGRCKLSKKMPLTSKFLKMTMIIHPLDIYNIFTSFRVMKKCKL